MCFVCLCVSVVACVYVCVHVSVCVCFVCACECVYVCVCVCAHVSVCACLNVWLWLSVCVPQCGCVCVCACVCMCVCMYACMYVCAFVCAFVCACVTARLRPQLPLYRILQLWNPFIQSFFRSVVFSLIFVSHIVVVVAQVSSVE